MPNVVRPVRLSMIINAALLAPAALSASPAMPTTMPQGLAPLLLQAADDDELVPIEEDKSFQSDGNGGFERGEGREAERDDFDDDDFDEEGFEEEGFEDEGIPIDKVPKRVLAAFKKQFGNDAELHAVYAESEDGHAHEYFIEGEAGQGQFIEMTVSADGEVYGYAQEIDFKKTPGAVQAAALKAVKDNQPEEIFCLLFQEDETHYHVAFEFDGEADNIEMTLSEDGEVLEQARGIDPSKLPVDILKLIEKEVGRNTHIEEAIKVESIDELPHYVVFGIAGNKGFELFATSDGSEVELELHDFEEENEFEEDDDFEEEDFEDDE
ncbi:MAG: hypothetical protein AAGI37_12280 [Planctomycetota bacterium]